MHRRITPLCCLFLAVGGAMAWSQQPDAVPIAEFSVTPAATGKQLVRASIPLNPGTLPASQTVLIDDGREKVVAAVRPIDWHDSEANKRIRRLYDGLPRPSSFGTLLQTTALEGHRTPFAAQNPSRRAIVTFPYTFDDDRSVKMKVLTAPEQATDQNDSALPLEIRMEAGVWTLAYQDGLLVQARPIWPEADQDVPWQRETVEQNSHYLWIRWVQPEGAWSRIVEMRADALGQVVAVAHLQRRERDGHWSPRFGWDLEVQEDAQIQPAAVVKSSERDLKLFHSFASSKPHRKPRYALNRYCIAHPTAPWKRRGAIYTQQQPNGLLQYRYLRSDGDDRVAMQPYAWRRAEFVVSPLDVALPRPTLTSPHNVRVAWQDWDRLYGSGAPLKLPDQPLLDRLVEYHRDATLACSAVGSDWGNVNAYHDGQSHGTVFGMNRLNHCPAIFFEAMRTGMPQLTESALAWCDNFHDLTIWWGPPNPSRPNSQTGGSRYNNLRATDETPPEDDWSYMWRGDKSVTFCTKGYDSFLLAYEETGDPRMAEALAAQLSYAFEHVRCDDGECRNIGDVADFVRLYECTGENRYRDHALRLFRELRTKLNDEHLFEQSGKPIVPQPGYIDDDEKGKKYPFAKPYIIGYALAGCPRLATHAPDEPRLQEMVLAVGDFLAESQDPLGGWRYPHPKSSRVITSQALEHVWQLVQASQLPGVEATDRQEKYLDAIERTLKLRFWVWKATGKVSNNLHGWEMSSGNIKEPQDIYALYQKPGDRDGGRDYREGRLALGSSGPEGLVYFSSVLRFYLKHRPASRLTSAPDPQSPLGQVLARIAKFDFQTKGVRDDLPVFRRQLAERLTFPLSWHHAQGQNFATWRDQARARVLEALQTAPPDAPFSATTVATRDHESYASHKIVFNLNSDSRVPALLTVPKGAGPFPAVLLLHDHGAEFRIGKEKVIEPWSEGTERQELARAWVNKYYGGRFLGDELARRGYVCLAVDALNWSDRGGAGFDGQQALASNLMHLGSSLAGRIAHEDLRAAEFLASRPEVDRSRIAAMGLSMGSFRTWQVAALSDHIAAGVAVCWMATVKGLMVPRNNHTEGKSAFAMLHPGLFNDLDYPDVASIACPKPMLFYNGRQDKLFPVASVEEAYKKMREVWQSQGADGRLVTKIWDVPHEFNLEMQKAAFAWLDEQLQKYDGLPRPSN